MSFMTQLRNYTLNESSFLNLRLLVHNLSFFLCRIDKFLFSPYCHKKLSSQRNNKIWEHMYLASLLYVNDHCDVPAI